MPTTTLSKLPGRAAVSHRLLVALPVVSLGFCILGVVLAHPSLQSFCFSGLKSDLKKKKNYL